MSSQTTTVASPLGAVGWAGGVWAGALLAASGLIARTVFATGPLRGLGGFLYIDSFGALMLLLITLVGLMATLYSTGYMRHEVSRGQAALPQAVRYFGWVQLWVAIMIAAVVVENLGYLWVAVEATTLVSAVLVGFYNRREALEAAWKYVILCGVGIAFAMLGLILLYSAGVRAGMDHAQALNWTALMANAGKLDPGAVRMAFALILVGFGTKAGLVPMHSWLPDAYSQAPAPVAMLSGALVNVALYGILRFHAVAVTAIGPAFSSHMLLAFGLISLGLAALFLLVQQDIKRLLAYSSVEHTGLICIGVGLGGPVGLFGAVLHMIGHTLVKPLLLMTAGNLGHRYHTYHMDRIRGAVRTLPITGPLLVAGVLAITGAPPGALFLSEFSIAAAGFHAGMGWASALALLFIAVAFAGMLLHLREMALGEVPHGIETGERPGWSHLPLLLPLILVVLLGIWIPPFLAGAIRQVAAIIGGGV